MFFFWLTIKEENDKRIALLQEQGFDIELFSNKERLIKRLDALDATPTLVFLNTNAINVAMELCLHAKVAVEKTVDLILSPIFIEPDQREQFIASGGREVIPEPVGPLELASRFRLWSQEKSSKGLFDRELANAGSMAMMAMESSAEMGVALNFCRRILASSGHDVIAETCFDIVSVFGETCCIEMFDGVDARYYFFGGAGDAQKAALKAVRNNGRVLLNSDLQINQSHLALRIGHLTEEALVKFQDSTDNLSILMDLANQFVLQENHRFKHSQLEKHHNDFLENVGGELQTRLSVMLKFATAINKLTAGHTLTDMNVQGLKSTYVNSIRLKKIVDAMSDLIQVSCGMNEAQYPEIDIPTLFNEFRDSFSLVAKQLSNTTFLLGKVAPVTLKTDEKYLRRIFSYLIDRAIESTKNGKITLNCIRKELPEKTLTILQIIDSGTVLTASQIDKLMNQSASLNEDDDSKFDINMVYARTFSALLGGKLHLFSEPERGTTFTISFIHDNTPEPEVTETTSSGIEFF